MGLRVQGSGFRLQGFLVKGSLTGCSWGESCLWLWLAAVWAGHSMSKAVRVQGVGLRGLGPKP